MPDSPHLTPVELVSFWDLEVEGARVIEILAHLARGCPACLPLAAELPWPLPIASPAIAEEERAGALARMQDFRIRAAFKKVLAANAALDAAQDQAAAEVAGQFDLGELSEVPPPTQTLLLARADAWLWKARALRREDPESCLFAAVLAVSFADALDPAQHPEGRSREPSGGGVGRAGECAAVGRRSPESGGRALPGRSERLGRSHRDRSRRGRCLLSLGDSPIRRRRRLAFLPAADLSAIR